MSVGFKKVGLNTEIYSVNLLTKSETGKYGPEKTPYLDTFLALVGPKLVLD